MSVALVPLLGASPLLAAPSLEEAVKASYLYKFAPFVEWPPEAFPNPTTPLSICVVGDDSFTAVVEGAVRGQTFNGRAVVIHRLTTVDPGSACHILFFSRALGRNAEDALKGVAHEPVLTVTDAEHGGVIQFLIEDGHVRFDIDEGAARLCGITLSSKLLNLAVSHKRGAGR